MDNDGFSSVELIGQQRLTITVPVKYL